MLHACSIASCRGPKVNLPIHFGSKLCGSDVYRNKSFRHRNHEGHSACKANGSNEPAFYLVKDLEFKPDGSFFGGKYTTFTNAGHAFDTLPTEGNKYEYVRQKLPPNEVVPFHSHHGDSTVVLLKGASMFVVNVDDNTNHQLVMPGDIVRIKANTEYSIRNGRLPTELLCHYEDNCCVTVPPTP